MLELTTDLLPPQRDQDQLTSLTTTLTTLRTTQTHQNSTISSLETANRDLRRQLDTSNATVRSAQAAAHTAELNAKNLREELSRAKTTLAQVRQQCANDVRRRDIQIQRLKSHLTGAQRGSNTRSVGPSCNITTSARSTGSHPLNGSLPSTSGNGSSRGQQEDAPRLEDAQYSLKQETNEFLTQLSQSMSDENDALIALIRDGLGTLRGLMSLPTGPAARTSRSEASDRDEMVTVVPTSFETLASDLEFVLGKLQVLLTRDDFVSIDEVYARDEEISRLRDGWEKMGSRWAEAVEMMRSWQEKLNGGGTVGLEELTRGMTLGDGLPLVDSVPEARVVSGMTASPRNEDDAEDGDDHDVSEAPEVEQDSSPLASPPVSRVLREASANIGSPSFGPAQARKLRQQRYQGQENRARTSTNSSASGGSNDKNLDLDLKGLSISRQDPRTRLTPSTTSEAATTSARSSVASRRTAASTTRTESAARSPLHKHINNLLGSSSSPDGPTTRTRITFKRSRTTQLPPTSPSKIKSTSSRPTLTRPASATPEIKQVLFASDSETSPFQHDEQDLQAEEPLPQADPAPVLSVAQKLRFAEQEARRLSGISLPSSDGFDPDPVSSPTKANRPLGREENFAHVVAVKSPTRFGRAGRMRVAGSMAKGRPRRRKSTLSPEELEDLMGLRSPDV